MKNMEPTEEDILQESGIEPGSSQELSPSEDGELNTEESESTEGEAEAPAGVDPEEYEALRTQYEALSERLGMQGQELGDARSYFRQIEPIMSKLRGNEDLVKALLDGTITAETVKTIAQGRQTQQSTVPKPANKPNTIKGMDKLTPEEITKLVEDKVSNVRQELETKLTAAEASRKFQARSTEFMENTPDFETYTKDIITWLENHPDQYDIEVAYHAVKGKQVTEAAAKAAEKRQAEEAKNIALNAGGGVGQGGVLPDGSALIDSLIGKISNPNVFQ